MTLWYKISKIFSKRRKESIISYSKPSEGDQATHHFAGSVSNIISHFACQIMIKN